MPVANATAMLAFVCMMLCWLVASMPVTLLLAQVMPVDVVVVVHAATIDRWCGC